MDKPVARVLLVDDNTEILKLMGMLLGAYFDITTATSGEQAMEFLQESSFDAIITDMKMPGMTGLELYSWIATSRPELAHRVIITTGDCSSLAEIETFAHSDAVCLKKPYTAEEVRAGVYELLAALVA